MVEIRIQIKPGVKFALKLNLTPDTIDSIAKDVGVIKDAELEYTIPEVEHKDMVAGEFVAKLRNADANSAIHADYEKKFPNAPKTQPCDKCHRPAKRVSKTMKTATYHCLICDCDTIISLRS